MTNGMRFSPLFTGKGGSSLYSPDLFVLVPFVLCALRAMCCQDGACPSDIMPCSSRMFCVKGHHVKVRLWGMLRMQPAGEGVRLAVLAGRDLPLDNLRHQATAHLWPVAAAIKTVGPRPPAMHPGPPLMRSRACRHVYHTSVLGLLRVLRTKFCRCFWQTLLGPTSCAKQFAQA